MILQVMNTASHHLQEMGTNWVDWDSVLGNIALSKVTWDHRTIRYTGMSNEVEIGRTKAMHQTVSQGPF